MDLTEEQIERYSRNIILTEVGGKGQKKLAEAKVFLIGAGGLGSPIGYYLAAAGVGKLGLIDSDHVELNNLQRQIAHKSEDVGRPKVESAKDTFEALNPEVEIVAYNERLSSENMMDLIKDYDMVVDGSDNFPTRYLANDASVLSDKPLFTGAVLRFDGQAMTVIPRKTPCYRCLFEQPPPPGFVPSCEQAGIMGVLPGLIGLVQATEVIKYILGVGTLLTGSLLVVNALDMSFRKVKVPRNEKCPVCGENPTVTELIDYEEFCGVRRPNERRSASSGS